MQNNVHKLDRIISIVAGGALATYGFLPKTQVKRFTVPSLITSVVGAGLTTYGLFFQKKRVLTPRNIILGAIGTGLILRGITGKSLIYKGLGISTNKGVTNVYGENVTDTTYHVPQERKGKKVERTIVVNAPVDKVYKFFSNFENFPQFMDYVDSVRYTGADRTHWKVKSRTGLTFEYEARIKTNVPNEVISWESVSGDIPNAGAVRFENVNGSTRVNVTMEVNPPAGKIGEVVADVLYDPDKQLEESLLTAKRVIEGGAARTKTA